MAQLRVIAIAMVGAIGCHCGSPPKHAPPVVVRSGLTPPPGWQALPSVQTAARQPGVVGSEAWGDTARGCYAAWVAMRGGGDELETMADQLVKSVTGAATVHDVVKSAGAVAFSFDKGVYHGKLRAQLARDGAITALACFWNQREPVACEQACTKLVGAQR